MNQNYTFRQNVKIQGYSYEKISINLCCEMLQMFRNYCARSNKSIWTILVSPILSPNGCPSNLTTLPPSDGRESTKGLQPLALSLQPPPLSLQPPTLSLQLLTLSLQPSTLSFQPPQYLRKHRKDQT